MILYYLTTDYLVLGEIKQYKPRLIHLLYSLSLLNICFDIKSSTYSVSTKKGHHKVNKAEVHFVSNCTIKEILVRKSKNTLMSSSAALLAFDITYTQCGNFRNLLSLTHFLFYKKIRERKVFQKKLVKG